MGAAASRYFSREWGGTVRIASVHVTPLGHVKLRGILLVSPTSDTIFDGESIYCHFDRFPVDGEGLSFSRVRISNASYHMAVDSNGINLKYIFNYFAHPERPEDTTPSGPFVVHVRRLILNNIHYKQDLRQQGHGYDYGVNIPHMDFTRIDGNFKDIRVEGYNVDCRIVRLAAEERSGFCLRDLSADVKVSGTTIAAHNMELATDNTHLRCDAVLNYNGWESFSHNGIFDSVLFSLLLNDGSVVGLKDAAYWAPGLWGLDETVLVAGSVNGPLSLLKIDSLKLAFGQHTRIDFDGVIDGLPHINRTAFNLNIQPSLVDPADLAAFHQPRHPFFRLPATLHQLGLTSVEATLRGSLQHGNADIGLRSDAGDLTVHADVAYDKMPRDLRYSALLQSDRLHLARLVRNSPVSTTGVNIKVHGYGTNLDDLKADADVELDNTIIHGHAVAPLHAALRLDRRQFALQGHLDDTLAALRIDGKGRLDGDSTAYDVRLNLRHCHLSELLGKDDSTRAVTFSTNADISLQGTQINTLRGDISLYDNMLRIGNRQSPVDDIRLSLDEDRLHKTMHLQSGIASLDLDGYLDYNHLPLIWQQFRHRFLPTDIASAALTSADSAALATTAFDINLRWNDPHRQLMLLLPDLHVASGSRLHVNYNFTESMKLVAQSDSVRYGNLLLRDIVVTGNPVGESYGSTCRVDRMDMSGLPLFWDLQLYASANPTLSRLRITWDDDANNVRDQGNIALLVHHADSRHRLQLTDPTFYLRGTRWDIVCDDIMLAKQTLLIPRLDVRSATGAISATASVSPDSAVATATFEHIAIDLLDSLLLADKNLRLEGTIDGQLRAQRAAQNASPYLLADLSVDECAVNGQPLGTVNIRSALDIERQRLSLGATSTLHRESGTLHPVAAHGYITLDDNPQIDLSVHLDNFALATVAPLLSSFASRVDGTVSSNIQIGGALSQPRVEGVAHIHDGLLQVDYTGVTYSCDDSVSLANGRIFVNNFHIRDQQGNVLVANGGIDYSEAGNLRIGLDVKSDRILVLNTGARGSNPYGSLVAAVAGTVSGTAGNLTIDASAKTRAGSEITIPVDNKLSSAEHDYIHFVTPNRSVEHKDVDPSTVAVAATTPAINLTLSITPDLMLHVPVDLGQIGAGISAAGTGNLKLHTGAGRKLNLVGNYEFSSGTLDLSMLSLIDKSFAIEPGSSLLFPGEISNIRFDISAVYALRASIASLTGNETESSQRNIPVQSIINLAGNLQEPAITFDIRLPNVDAATSEEVFAYIDRSDQRDMLNQTVSLLVMGQFYSNANESHISSATSTSGYGVMAKSAAAIVTQMVKVVDIDFGYTAATDLTTEQFDIDISKSWDRFYFESTLGYGGESRNLSNSADAHAMSNLVGDILVGYRINPRLHFFVFNRTNTNDYTRIELPYKQGVGLKYTRDFNRWSDLFHRQRQQ